MSDHRQPSPPSQNESPYHQSQTRPLSWVPDPVYPPPPPTNYDTENGAGLFGAKKSSVQNWLAKMTTNTGHHEDPEVFGTAAAMSHGDVQL